MLTPRVLKGSLSVIYIYMSEELYYIDTMGLHEQNARNKFCNIYICIF